MKPLNLDEVVTYVADNIGTFHKKRIDSLNKLKLDKVLKRKNPYLFKAKHVLTASEIVKSIVDAHISSNEETIFGDWLEGLAIFINEKVFNGQKSTTTGIDLEFTKDGKRYIISIKSGPNWGNSGQIKKMLSDFKTAQKTLNTSGHTTEVVAVNGCCYGIDNNPFKGNYYKFCGQKFWELISGDSELYTKIVEPLGNMAKERNEEFMISYSNILNKFTREFSVKFCDSDGNILWDDIIKHNSLGK